MAVKRGAPALAPATPDVVLLETVGAAAASLTTFGTARTVTSSVAATNQINARNQWLRISCTTTSAISKIEGASFQYTRIDFDPLFTTEIEIPTALINRRVFVGLVSATFPAAETLATISACAFRYSTGSSDTTWQCVCANASAQTVVNSGVTVAADTRYVLKIDTADAANIKFYINNLLVATISATLPATTTNLAPNHHITSLTNTGQKDLDVAWMRLEQA